MIIIINSAFRTNSGPPILYLHDVWHLQDKLKLRVFWTITLFSTRVNGNLSLMQVSLPAITCSKLTIETLEQGVKYVQS